MSPSPPLQNQTDCSKSFDDGQSLTTYYAMADGAVPKAPVLTEIGVAHGKTAAQVALRWLIQQPRVATLSKTAQLSRLQENYDVFDFELSDQDIRVTHGLAHTDGRIVRPTNLAPVWD